MRGAFAAITIALLLSWNAFAMVDCDSQLGGKLPPSEQFYRLITSYIAIDPQAQSLIPPLLESKTPINPFAKASTTSAIQMKLALEGLVSSFSESDWKEVQTLFTSQNKTAKQQAVDQRQRSIETSKVRRLEFQFKDKKTHSVGNIPITSVVTFKGRTFATQAFDHRIQIYELDYKTGQLISRVNMNADGMAQGTPIFLVSKTEELFVAALSETKIHLYQYDLDSHLLPLQHLLSPFAGSILKTELPDGRTAVWVYDGAIPDSAKESVRLFEFDGTKARLTEKGYKRSDKFNSVELMKVTDKELFFITGQQHPEIYTVDRETFQFKESWVKNLSIQTAPRSARIGNSGLVVGGHEESVDLWDFLNKTNYDIDSVEIEGDHAYNAPIDVISIGDRTFVVSATAGALTLTEILHDGTSLKVLKRFPFEFFEQQKTRYSVVLPEVDGRILLMYTDLSTIDLFEFDKKTHDIRFVQSIHGNFRGRPHFVQTDDQIFVVGVGFDGNLFVVSVLSSVR